MPPRPVLTVEKPDAPLEGRILAVATDLFIRHGYKAVSFLAIAKEVGITHSHVHYYFRTKLLLAEAVLDAYVAGTTADFRAIWTDPDADLLTRLTGSRDWIWRQYLRFNPGGAGGQNWGLLARFAAEADLLTPGMRKTIGATLREMDGFVEAGFVHAIRRGELAADAPVQALVLQVSSLLHTSRHTTRLEGSFRRLDELLKWTYEVIHLAYGSGSGTGARAWQRLAVHPALIRRRSPLQSPLGPSSQRP